MRRYVWLCHVEGREGGQGKDFVMTHVTGGEEAASSPPARAAAVPALGNEGWPWEGALLPASP